MISEVTNQPMEQALKYARQIAYSSECVLQFSYDAGKKYKDIPNTCMVEAGVAAGAQVIALMAGSECKVPIWALDSWAGIPLASNRDDQAPGLHFFTKAEQMSLPDPGKQVLISSGATVVDQDDFINHVHNAIGDKLNLVMVKGWFEEVLPNLECPPISVLRLDGDLYNSTYVCLKYLYPKVIKGGLVIVDDWALPGCKWAVIEYMGEVGENPNYEVINGEGSQMCYWTK